MKAQLQVYIDECFITYEALPHVLLASGDARLRVGPTGGQQIRESRRSAYSHSMVPGGLDVTSSTTRLTSRTSLVIRVEIFSSTS